MSLGLQWATGALGPPLEPWGPQDPGAPESPQASRGPSGSPEASGGQGLRGEPWGSPGAQRKGSRAQAPRGPQGPPGAPPPAPGEHLGPAGGLTGPPAARRPHAEGFQGSCGQRAPLAVRRPPGAQRAPIELVRESKGPCSPKRGLLGGFQDPWVPRAPSTQGSRCPRRAPRVPGAREEP